MSLKKRRARIITGKPYCDLPIGAEVILYETDEELLELERDYASLTVYTDPDENHPVGEAWSVTVYDIEIIKERR